MALDFDIIETQKRPGDGYTSQGMRNNKMHIAPTNNIPQAYTPLRPFNYGKVRSFLPCLYPTAPGLSRVQPGVRNLVVNSELALHAGSGVPTDVYDRTRRLRKYQYSNQARRCLTRLGPNSRATIVASASGYQLRSGLSSCKNPRCPRCVYGIMHKREAEIQTIIDFWLQESPLHSVEMVTLTAPHYTNDLGSFLGSSGSKTGIAGALRLWKERYPFKLINPEFVSGMETTYSPKNGYHVHFHVLLILKTELTREQKTALRDSWIGACVDAKLPKPSKKHGFKVQKAHSAAFYMSKWGLAAEMTTGHVKSSKTMPWAKIADLVLEGVDWAADVYQRFNAEMHRKKVHTFSRGLAGLRFYAQSRMPALRPVYVFPLEESLEVQKSPELLSFLRESLRNKTDLFDLKEMFNLKGYYQNAYNFFESHSNQARLSYLLKKGLIDESLLDYFFREATKPRSSDNYHKSDFDSALVSFGYWKSCYDVYRRRLSIN